MSKAGEIVLSGMRPTGELHLGNYFGALKKWVEIQNQYRCYWMIADLHSLTTLKDTKDIAQKTWEMVAIWLASGLNPKKSTIFLQSAIPEHGELSSIFATLLPVPMLALNPTYKEMIQEYPQAASFGLLNYPVLQAADILIYKASKVPIGQDQEPHIEISREIARRFNSRFKKLFPEPQALFGEMPKVFSLQDPSKKMSKSHDSDSYIGLLDSALVIRQKIKGAVTDSGKDIIYDREKKPAISNLLGLFQLVSGMPIKKLEAKYRNSGYAEFKSDLAETVITHLEPIQKKYAGLTKNLIMAKKVLKSGSQKARSVAQKNMAEIKSKIGLLQL